MKHLSTFINESIMISEKKDFFEKHGIEKKTGTIGWSEKEQKWYGWSHRAIYGFGIGSTVKKGNCGYTEERGEWTAKTLEDARQMAEDFAKAVD